MKRLFVEAVSLSSPRGRLLVFAGLSLAIYLSRYHWLDNLSLIGSLGFKRAPSIGLTRAYWLLLHGRPTAAWRRNPLIYLVLAIGLPLLFHDVYKLVARREGQLRADRLH